MAEYTTTPMNAEQFISNIPEAKQIALALRNIGVELILDEETGIKAVGKTTLRPFSRAQVSRARIQRSYPSRET